MFKTIPCMLLLLIASVSPSLADEAIGGSYFTNSSVSSGYTIISSATNVNGLHVRTIMVACSTGSSIAAVPPGTGVTSRLILICNAESSGLQGNVMLPNPIFLPAGYALVFAANSSSQNEVYMTYDLDGGP